MHWIFYQICRQIRIWLFFGAVFAGAVGAFGATGGANAAEPEFDGIQTQILGRKFNVAINGGAEFNGAKFSLVLRNADGADSAATSADGAKNGANSNLDGADGATFTDGAIGATATAKSGAKSAAKSTARRVLYSGEFKDGAKLRGLVISGLGGEFNALDLRLCAEFAAPISRQFCSPPFAARPAKFVFNAGAAGADFAGANGANGAVLVGGQIYASLPTGAVAVDASGAAVRFDGLVRASVAPKSTAKCRPTTPPVEAVAHLVAGGADGGAGISAGADGATTSAATTTATTATTANGATTPTATTPNSISPTFALRNFAFNNVGATRLTLTATLDAERARGNCGGAGQVACEFDGEWAWREFEPALIGVAAHFAHARAFADETGGAFALAQADFDALGGTEVAVEFRALLADGALAQAFSGACWAQNVGAAFALAGSPLAHAFVGVRGAEFAKAGRASLNNGNFTLKKAAFDGGVARGVMKLAFNKTAPFEPFLVVAGGGDFAGVGEVLRGGADGAGANSNLGANSSAILTGADGAGANSNLGANSSATLAGANGANGAVRAVLRVSGQSADGVPVELLGASELAVFYGAFALSRAERVVRAGSARLVAEVLAHCGACDAAAFGLGESVVFGAGLGGDLDGAAGGNASGGAGEISGEVSGGELNSNLGFLDESERRKWRRAAWFDGAVFGVRLLGAAGADTDGAGTSADGANSNLGSGTTSGASLAGSGNGGANSNLDGAAGSGGVGSGGNLGGSGSDSSGSSGATSGVGSGAISGGEIGASGALSTSANADFAASVGAVIGGVAEVSLTARGAALERTAQIAVFLRDASYLRHSFFAPLSALKADAREAQTRAASVVFGGSGGGAAWQGGEVLGAQKPAAATKQRHHKRLFF